MERLADEGWGPPTVTIALAGLASRRSRLQRRSSEPMPDIAEEIRELMSLLGDEPLPARATAARRWLRLGRGARR
jgi:hypothetical protein